MCLSKLLSLILAVGLAASNTCQASSVESVLGTLVPGLVVMVLGDARLAGIMKALYSIQPVQATLSAQRFCQIALNGSEYVRLEIERRIRLRPLEKKVIEQIVGEIVGEFASFPGAGRRSSR